MATDESDPLIQPKVIGDGMLPPPLPSDALEVVMTKLADRIKTEVVEALEASYKKAREEEAAQRALEAEKLAEEAA